jgi:AAA family ATP:ADP antiporter
MITAKSLNYSVNTPAIKRLFIPTSSQVRYKAQTWIETFGSRASGQIGNGFNSLFGRFEASFGSGSGKTYFLYLSLAIVAPLVYTWFKTARFLGGSYKKAIKDHSKIC